MNYSAESLTKFTFRVLKGFGCSDNEADVVSDHLVNANLRKANFRNGDLEGTDFSGADLRGADFTNSSLIGASFCTFKKVTQIELATLELSLFLHGIHN